MSDWRLNGQEEYLSNVELKYIKYGERTVANNNWDHEHCAFCWEKISDYSDDLKEAYCTLDERDWICPDCFSDFCDTFHWVVV